MKSYFRFVLRHRAAVLLLCLVVTAVATASLSRAVIASSVVKLFLGESPDYDRYVERVREFGSDDIFVVGIEEPHPFGLAALDRLQAVIERVEAMEDVARVDSVLSAQHVWGEEDTLFVETFGDEAREYPKRRATLVEELCSDPLTSGLLVSSDGQHMAVIIELEPDADRPAERVPLLVKEVLELFEKTGFVPERLHRAGVPAVVAAVMDETHFNLSRLFPLVVLVLVLAVYAIFHRLWPVFITTSVALLAVIWTMGLAVLLDRNVNILMAIVPQVILIVSFSDVIHLCSAYLLELEHGWNKEQAILKSAADVGSACLLTSLTTFVGFLCLSLVPTPVFRQLGLVLGVGVAVALFIAMTLVPVFFSLMKEPRRWRTGAAFKVQKQLDAILDWTRRMATGHPWVVLVGFGLLFAASVQGLSQIRIETDLAKRLDENHSVRIDARYFEQHFAGSNTLNVFVETPERSGLLDPDLFASIASYQRTLERMPDVDKVISVVDLVETIYRELNAGEVVDVLPKSREALAQLLLLFELSGGEDLSRFIDFERRTMRLALRLNTEAMRATADVGLEAEALAEGWFGQGVRAEASGLFFLIGRWLEKIVVGQQLGLLVSFITIAVMMVIGLGSLRVGLWSMLPNLLPLLVLGGTVGLAWTAVDSDTMIVAMLAIGIGVDDTIHFLMRLRIEARRARNTLEAVERTFHFTGRAIVITTVILTLGFLPFVLSSYFSLRILGTLLPMTLIVALLADVVLVPALVSLEIIKFHR